MEVFGSATKCLEEYLPKTCWLQIILEANFNRRLNFIVWFFGLHSEMKLLFCVWKDLNIEIISLFQGRPSPQTWKKNSVFETL